MLDATSDDKGLPRFATKEWIEVYDHSEKNYDLNKEIRIKAPMLRPDLCDFSDGCIFIKKLLLSLIEIMKKEIKALHLKIMHHLSIAFQKSMVYKLAMQKIWML